MKVALNVLSFTDGVCPQASKVDKWQQQAFEMEKVRVQQVLTVCSAYPQRYVE